MATPPMPPKPPRMHGITPPPHAIPTEILPPPAKQKSKRPWLLSLFILSNFFHSAVYLALAAVPWSDPQSGLATTLIAHPTLVFGVLPKMVQPSMGVVGASLNRVLPGLPVVFLFLAILYALAGWRLYDMDPWWYFLVRWGMMCNSGYIVVKFMLAMSADYFVSGGPRLMSDETMLLLIPVMGWNLLIVLYFAMMPDVAKAYDSAG
ncbi:MAG: hypothetical protein ABSD44_10425 [Terracidiphilus sp.]